MTSIEIPLDVRHILQLGERFCLPPLNNKKNFLFEFIKHVEYNIHKLDFEHKLEVRNLCLPIMKSVVNSNIRLTTTEKDLLKKTKATKLFLTNNPDIFITRADKGNTIVIMTKNDYIKKMLSSFNDQQTYELIHNGPSRKLTKGLHDLLVHWRSLNYITKNTYFHLHNTSSILPNAYGLPKIHKAGVPLRIIILL